MCKTCNSDAQTFFSTDFRGSSGDWKFTYYSYNGYFKYCCLEDYLKTLWIGHHIPSGEFVNWFQYRLSHKDHLVLCYKNEIILVHKSEKIQNRSKFRLPHHNSTLEINIINITNDIIKCSDLCNELKDTNELLEETNQELEETNQELEETKNENKLLKEENIELINNNIILKKEVEYFNSLKPKYNYLEMKQNKKTLHNEYKRIYKLIKKNIGFNLC